MMGLKERLGRLRPAFIERDKLTPAATLQRLFAVARVREEVLERGEQKRAEFPLLPVGALVDLVLQDIREETLRQVLRVMHGIPAPAGVSVKRRPVGLAQRGERGARTLRLGLCL